MQGTLGVTMEVTVDKGVASVDKDRVTTAKDLTRDIIKVAISEPSLVTSEVDLVLVLVKPMLLRKLKLWEAADSVDLPTMQLRMPPHRILTAVA